MTKDAKLRMDVMEQIQRLSGLPKFPFAMSAQLELAAVAIEKANGDLSRVAAVVGSLVDESACPTPGEFRAIWNRAFPQPPRDPCWQCRETPGWLNTWTKDRDGNDVSEARRCPCGAISRFREPTAEERENMRPFTASEKAEFEVANDEWFARLLAANKKRRQMLRPQRPFVELYPDAVTIREREMMRES